MAKIYEGSFEHAESHEVPITAEHTKSHGHTSTVHTSPSGWTPRPSPLLQDIHFLCGDYHRGPITMVGPAQVMCAVITRPGRSAVIWSAPRWPAWWVTCRSRSDWCHRASLHLRWDQTECLCVSVCVCVCAVPQCKALYTVSVFLLRACVCITRRSPRGAACCSGPYLKADLIRCGAAAPDTWRSHDQAALTPCGTKASCHTPADLVPTAAILSFMLRSCSELPLTLWNSAVQTCDTPPPPRQWWDKKRFKFRCKIFNLL